MEGIEPMRHQSKQTGFPLAGRIARITVIAGVIASMVFPAFAQNSTGQVPENAQSFEVDLALVLAVDVSSSMSRAEQELQRAGYAEAFLDPVLIQTINSGGPHGRIAIAYVEWAGSSHQRIIIPWTVIQDFTDAQRLASALSQSPILSGSGTSISNGLLVSWQLLQQVPVRAARMAIDISGDGLNNSGPSVASVRDEILAADVTINGLPISLRRGETDRFQHFGNEFLAAYFQTCVVGGHGAFVVGVHNSSQFGTAIRRKLVREISGHDDGGSMIHLARYALLADCGYPVGLPGR